MWCVGGEGVWCVGGEGVCVCVCIGWIECGLYCFKAVWNMECVGRYINFI